LITVDKELPADKQHNVNVSREAKHTRGALAMKLELYKALRSINIEEAQVNAVIQAMDTHIDNRISQATQPLLSKLDSVQNGLTSVQTVLSSKIDAIVQVKTETEKERDRRSQLVRWVIGTALAAVGTTLAVLKAMGYI
jgi:uncharacterized protein YPO0396